MDYKVNRTTDDIKTFPNIEKEEITLYKNIMNQTLDKNRLFLPNKIYTTNKKVNNLFKGGFTSNQIEKPYSVAKFEKILREYLKKPDNAIFNKIPELNRLFSVQLRDKKKLSKFLRHEKINIGQLVLYNLKEKDKSNLYNSQNNTNEKLLNFSRNFVIDPDKDIIQTQFYREKFWKVNSKIINLILENRDKRYSQLKELIKEELDIINNNDNNSIEKNNNENKAKPLFKMYNDSLSQSRNKMRFKRKNFNSFNKSRSGTKNFYSSSNTPRNVNFFNNTNDSTKTDRFYRNFTIYNQSNRIGNEMKNTLPKECKTFRKTNPYNTTLNLFKMKNTLKNKIEGLNLYVDKSNKKLIKLISTNITSQKHKLKDMLKKVSVKKDLMDKTASGEYILNSYKIKKIKKNKNHNLRVVKSIYEDAKKDLGMVWNKKPEEKIKLMSDKFNKMDNEMALNIIGRAYENHEIKGNDIYFCKEMIKEDSGIKNNKEERELAKIKLEFNYKKIMKMAASIKS